MKEGKNQKKSNKEEKNLRKKKYFFHVATKVKDVMQFTGPGKNITGSGLALQAMGYKPATLL